MTTPDCIVIGAQCCGTTSMRHYLSAHPAVIPPLIGETHYFSLNYDRGVEWYDAQLGDPQRGKLRMDKSPSYIADPAAPQRIWRDSPHSRFIVLLRDPVDRIWSHYRHMVRNGVESRPFRRAIRGHTGVPHGWYPYLRRGYYAEQLARWFSHFPKEQFCVVRSEEFFSDTHRVYNKVLSFLGLPSHKLKEYRHHNPGQRHKPMSPKMRRWLMDHYRPHNEVLYDLLGWKERWNAA